VTRTKTASATATHTEEWRVAIAAAVRQGQLSTARLQQ